MVIIDLEWARFIKTPVFNYINESDFYISENSQILIGMYHTYKEYAVCGYSHDGRSGFVKTLEYFHSKICFKCGSKLEYRISHDFWGCPKWNIGWGHATINPNPDYKKCSKDWLTNIITECNLRGKVKAMNLLKFYEENGLEDLRIFFDKGNTTGASINTLIDTNSRSKEQEKKCQIFLEDNWLNVVPQQWIEYKCKGDIKPKRCCPDYICGTPYNVMVADAKLNPHTADAAKMIEYGKLVQFILDQHLDKRKIELAILHDTDYDVDFYNNVNFIKIYEHN